MENQTDGKSSDIHVLAWLAGGTGIAASALTAGTLAVSCFSFGLQGAYITCQTASFAISAGAISAPGSGTLAAVGLASVGVGAAAAAAVYFMPWATLAKWICEAWDYFISLLKAVWRFFVGAFKLLVRFIRCIIIAIRDTGAYLATRLSTWLFPS
jgi:hypothetical protein